MNPHHTPSGIEAVGSVPWGSHFCQLYDNAQDMADILAPYFRAGLERNELCHWVTSEQFGPEDAKSALRAIYPNLDAALSKGQITIMDRRDWYSRGGSFRPEEVIAGWLGHEERARSDGYSGYRLTGDTLWLEAHDWDAFTEYETMVTEAFRPRRMVALCTYCMGRCGAAEVLDVVKNHAFAVARRRGVWEVVESASTKQAKSELALLNATLASKIEAATSELRTLVRQKDDLLREVHHRVKNNLQIVSNLLAMKGRRADDGARRVLTETADRVFAISSVHEALYEQVDGRGLLVTDRLGVIAEALATSYGLEDRVSVIVRGDDVRVSLNAGVPLALLATELTSNALKHAFPEGRAGQVEIVVTALAAGRFSLTVADDGVGWAPAAAKRGSGLGIAMALAKQLDGELVIELRPEGGTQARLEAAVQ